LFAIGNEEKQIEYLRQRLCSIRDFIPTALFQRIDRDSSGFVSAFELKNFLRDIILT
jgi:hypothetical protein